MKRIFLTFTAFGILTFLSFSQPLQAQNWCNPMEVPGLNGGSTGDPYILKYRGYYYLYVSAGDRNIYCWRSKDLVNWSDRYTCCTDETTAVAYAPEVIYWNGTFYMVTSPRGGGHYMLTSDSPTGPFVHRTVNMGRDIDGSMFVDDDGQWYFYHAHYDGIHASTMPTQLSFGDDVNLRCCITGQWTEGPCTFKRNGIYYLLYTGNHVWTDGYRIDYATSSASPLSGFTPQSEQNPILVDTETPKHKALGHGSAFIGPDLDTYYFVYHNLQDHKARRLLNFEMMGFNGDKLMMTGPTDWAQDIPATCQSDYFERQQIGHAWIMTGNGQWTIVDADHLAQQHAKADAMALFNTCAYKNYTAEFTVKAGADATGCFGAVLSYTDANNYSEAVIDVATRSLQYRHLAGGKVKVTSHSTLPEDFDPATWHALRVEKSGRSVRIYIDGMHKISAPCAASGGQIGYTTHATRADFGYVAMSPHVDGNAIRERRLPVPGMMAASFYATSQGSVSQTDIPLSSGTAHLVACSKGTALTYNVSIQRDQVYNIGLRYRARHDASIRILLDGKVVSHVITLPATQSDIRVLTASNIPLPGGHHRLTVQMVKGAAQLYEYNIKRGVATPHAMADNFDGGISPQWGYREGTWTVNDGMLESTGRYGKMLMGGFDDIHMTDYTVDCDILYPTPDTNAGILVRTTNASTGGADDSPALGTDFLQGYLVLVTGNSITIGKHNYGWQPLATGTTTGSAQAPRHHLRVVVEGATITAYVDDMHTPAVSYTDPIPFITGRAGLRAHNSVVRFDNFQVTPTRPTPPVR